MRHRVHGRKLGRKTQHRVAMWRNMAVALFTHGQITTTVPKAKSLKPFVEKLITAAKKGDLASRRHVISQLGGNKLMVADDEDEAVNELRNRYGELTKQARMKAPKVVKRLFDEIAPRYADRSGGYTRIIKLDRHRIGDAADLCVIQLVGEDDGGPQVAGRHSRRREAANKRMEFAAQRRKGAAPATDTSEKTEQPRDDKAPDAAEIADESQASDSGEPAK